MCEEKDKPCKEEPYYKIGINTYLAMQKLEIEENKYFMSEKMGYDVGFTVATFDYIHKGYAKKFRDYFVTNHHKIEVCQECGALETILKNNDMKRLHNLLGDGVEDLVSK